MHERTLVRRVPTGGSTDPAPTRLAPLIVTSTRGSRQEIRSRAVGREASRPARSAVSRGCGEAHDRYTTDINVRQLGSPPAPPPAGVGRHQTISCPAERKRPARWAIWAGPTSQQPPTIVARPVRPPPSAAEWRSARRSRWPPVGRFTCPPTLWTLWDGSQPPETLHHKGSNRENRERCPRQTIPSTSGSESVVHGTSSRPDLDRASSCAREQP